MQAIDFENARRKMLDQQIRPWDVSDARVLGVIAATRREEYVPEEYRALAYADMNIPLGFGQVMLAPKLEGRLLHTLGARSKDKVLEIGIGSGHIAALLSGLSSAVYAVEIVPQLAERASAKITGHGIRNVTVEVGDASRGWEKHAPYDRILVTGSVPIMPAGLRDQLTVGGRMVIVVGRAPAMEVLRIDRLGTESWKTTSLFETVIPPLTNAPEPPKFVF